MAVKGHSETSAVTTLERLCVTSYQSSIIILYILRHFRDSRMTVKNRNFLKKV